MTTEILCKALTSLSGLGLFLAAEPGVLQENDVAVLHLCDSLGCCISGDMIVGDELDFLAELLGKALCNRCQGLTLVGSILDLAEMGAEDDLCALIDQLLNGGQSGNDTGLIGDLLPAALKSSTVFLFNAAMMASLKL